MSDKSTRKKNVSSGARKGRADRGTSRRNTTAIADAAGYLFLKDQKRNRWPSQDTMEKAHELAIDKKANRRGKPGKARPADVGFPLLDTLVGTCPKALDTILTAASLKLKRVRRYPGWILQRVYNLKDRPIQLI
jgi:hypothetical protein